MPTRADCNNERQTCGFTVPWDGPVVDCDVHAHVPGIDALFPYLAPVWREFIEERGWRAPVGLDVIYPPNAPSSCRAEWRPADGRVPASDLTLLQDHILERFAVDHAVITCYYAVDSLRHPDWAAAMASAVNDWLIAEWLERDSRLVASLVVPARNPEAMIREIDRVGSHPGFVQVLFPVRSDRLYGNRIWHDVYATVARHDLVLGLHMGGSTEGAPSPTGWPSWYVEEYVSEIQIFEAQIVSMVAEGVFQVAPDLRVAVLEGGFTWLPSLVWRMDTDWKALRREIPWVNRPPSSVIREHMRFSVSPVDAGPREDLANVVKWLDSEEMLMFASDYPHFHDDDMSQFLDVLPPNAKAKVMSENARTWYRLA